MNTFTRFGFLLILLYMSSASLKAADPSLSCSPQNLSFSATVAGQQVKEVIVKGSNFPALTTLSSFTVSLTGENSNQFSVENPSLNLVQLLVQVLGGGEKLKVTYHPTAAGIHSAKILISAKLLGVVNTINTEIDLSGATVSTDLTPPEVISTTPDAGATGVSTSDPISITYDGNILIANAGLITINGAPANASVSGNVLTVTPTSALANGTSYEVRIGTGAVKDVAGNLSDSDYYLSFMTQEPSPVISFEVPSVDFTTEVGVSTTKSINLLGHNILSGSTLVDLSASISGDDASQFSVETPSLLDVVPNLLSGGQLINVTYLPGVQAIHHAKLTIMLQLLGIDEPIVAEVDLNGMVSVSTKVADEVSGKAIVSEDFYTASGIPVKSADKSGIYLKKVVYEDGSYKVFKFVKTDAPE